MAFKHFITMTRLENLNFIVTLVWLFQYPKFLSCFLQLVTNLSRWELIGEFIIVCVIIDDEVDNFTHVMKLIFPSLLGARTALPMGIAPEAIVDFFSIGYKVYSSSSLFNKTCIKKFVTHFLLKLYVSSGVLLALRMGVAPKAMVEYW
jgi:hypothetical protein